MLWNVEQRKPAAIRRREIVDCFDDDLDGFVAGIHFDANLSVFKIYFVPAAIAAANNGVGHVSSPRLLEYWRVANLIQDKGRQPLKFDPRDFVECELLPRAVVELGRPRRFVIGDGLGMFQRTAVFEIGSNASGSKSMAAG